MPLSPDAPGGFNEGPSLAKETLSPWIRAGVERAKTFLPQGTSEKDIQAFIEFILRPAVQDVDRQHLSQAETAEWLQGTLEGIWKWEDAKVGSIKQYFDEFQRESLDDTIRDASGDLLSATESGEDPPIAAEINEYGALYRVILGRVKELFPEEDLADVRKFSVAQTLAMVNEDRNIYRDDAFGNNRPIAMANDVHNNWKDPERPKKAYLRYNTKRIHERMERVLNHEMLYGIGDAPHHLN
jgi:hypothetical protein